MDISEPVAPVVADSRDSENPLLINFSEVPRPYWERVITPEVERLYVDLLEEAKELGDSAPYIRLQGSTLRALFLTGYTPIGSSIYEIDPDYSSDIDAAVSWGVMRAARNKEMRVRELNGFEVGKMDVDGRELGFVAVEDLRGQYETALKELKDCLGCVREKYSSYTCEEMRGTDIRDDSLRLLKLISDLDKRFRGGALDVDVIERLACLKFETLGLNVTLSPKGELQVTLMDSHGLVEQSQRLVSLGCFTVANSVFQKGSLLRMYLECWEYIQQNPDMFSTYYPRWAMETIMRVLVVGVETGSFFQAQDSNPDYVLLRQFAELIFGGSFDENGVAEADFWDKGTKDQLYRDMSRAFANDPLIAFKYVFEYMPLSWMFGKGLHDHFGVLHSKHLAGEDSKIEQTIRAMMIRAYSGRDVDLRVVRGGHLSTEGFRTYKPEVYPRSMNEIIALLLVGLHECHGDELDVKRIVDEVVASWPDSVDDRIPFYWAVGWADRPGRFGCRVTRAGIIEEVKKFAECDERRYAEVREFQGSKV